MGHNSSHKVLENICSSLERRPKSIKEVAEETGHHRGAVSRYLKMLEKTGLIHGEKVGRERIFWRPVLSDLLTGLELRGAAYELGKIQDHVNEASEKIEALIEESNDPEEINPKSSTTPTEEDDLP